MMTRTKWTGRVRHKLRGQRLPVIPANRAGRRRIPACSLLLARWNAVRAVGSTAAVTLCPQRPLCPACKAFDGTRQQLTAVVIAVEKRPRRQASAKQGAGSVCGSRGDGRLGQDPTMLAAGGQGRGGGGGGGEAGGDPEREIP